MIYDHNIYLIGFYRFRLGNKIYKVLGYGEKWSKTKGKQVDKNSLLVQLEIYCMAIPYPEFEPRKPFNMDFDFIKKQSILYKL